MMVRSEIFVIAQKKSYAQMQLEIFVDSVQMDTLE